MSQVLKMSSNCLKWSLYCLLLFLNILLPYVVAECTLRAQDGSISTQHMTTLEPLKGKNFIYKSMDVNNKEEYEYILSICSEIGSGTNAAIIQKDLSTPSRTPVILGKIDQTSIKRGTDWIMLTFKGGDKYRHHCDKSERQAHLMLICNKDTLAKNFTVLYEENMEEQGNCFYLLEMQSKVACSKVDQGLSTGSVILIVLASLIVVYLAVGMLYKRCVHGKRGMEQIPNNAFWKTCGSLQADGCDWLCRCQESGFDSSRPYHGIADDQLDDEADDENLLPM